MIIIVAIFAFIILVALSIGTVGLAGGGLLGISSWINGMWDNGITFGDSFALGIIIPILLIMLIFSIKPIAILIYFIGMTLFPIMCLGFTGILIYECLTGFHEYAIFIGMIIYLSIFGSIYLVRGIIDDIRHQKKKKLEAEYWVRKEIEAKKREEWNRFPYHLKTLRKD